MSRSDKRPGRLPGDGPRYGERRDGRGSSYRGRDRDEQGGRSGGYGDRRGGDRGNQGYRSGSGYRDRDGGRGGRDRRPYGDRDDARRGYGSRDRYDQGSYRGREGGFDSRGSGRGDRWDRGDRPQRSYGDRDGGRREFGRGRDDRGGYRDRDGFRRDDRDRPGGFRDREGGFAGRGSGYGDRWDRGDRPQRSYGDRDGGRREFGRGRDDRGFRDRDSRRGAGDRPWRDRGDRPQRSFGDRDGGRREFTRDRDERGGRRPEGRTSQERTARPFSKEGYREREEARSIRARFGRSESADESPAPSERDNLPEVPADVTPDELDKEVRDSLLSLPRDLRNLIAVHLVAAERALAEEDTERAYEHAKVARRFGSRVGVVREAAGVAAYRAGYFAEALNDLRAARRLTGADDLLPILADCERGLGRPERALDLIRSPEAERVGRAVRVELAIVESGARRDLGQKDAAVVTLQRLPELRDDQPHPWSARLAFAYADALADAGHKEAAVDWFSRAMSFDEEGETDAAVRYAELTGTPIDEIEDIEEDADDEPDLESAEARDDVLGDDEDAGTPDEAAAVREQEPEHASDEATGKEPHDGPGLGPDPATSDAADAAQASDTTGEASREAESGADAADSVTPAEGVAPQGPKTGEPDRPRDSESGESAVQADEEPGTAAAPEASADAEEPGRLVEQGADAAGSGQAEDSGKHEDHAPSAVAPAEPEPRDTGDPGTGTEKPAAPDTEPEPGKTIDLGPAFIEPDFGDDAVAGTPVPGKREA